MDTQIHRERWRLLHQVVRLPEVPMMILGFVWVVLLSIDMARGLQGRLAIVSEVIWIIFGLDFLLEFLIAPKKIVYLKRHWPVALSLAVPAFRIVRFVRVVHLTRAAAAAPAAHTLASMNRALAALGATLRRRGFAYVSLLTILAMVIGAAAIENFERGGGNASGIHDYGTALWWTAMLMTTLGPTSWPVTVAGRILCFILGLYAFTVFGYVTATLATYFIDRDADRAYAAVAGERSLAAIQARLDAVQQMLDARLPPRLDERGAR